MDNQLKVSRQTYERGSCRLTISQGHRVIALLDGDGVIFNSSLISQGRAGGHLAAQKLSDSIIQHLNATNGTNQYQLWVYVFLNKRGLTDTFGRARLSVAKHRFEEFIIGFNQAAERFMMVDVGSEKEAADAKIKGRCAPQVYPRSNCSSLVSPLLSSVVRR